MGSRAWLRGSTEDPYAVAGVSRTSEAVDVSCATRRGESGHERFSPEAQREQRPGPHSRPPRHTVCPCTADKNRLLLDGFSIQTFLEVTCSAG